MKKPGRAIGGRCGVGAMFLGLILAGCQTAPRGPDPATVTPPDSGTILRTSYQTQDSPSAKVVPAGGTQSCPFG